MATAADGTATKIVSSSGPTVLMGSKPSYYPIYVRQPGGGRPGTLPDLPGTGAKAPAATHTPLTPSLFPTNFDELGHEHTEPELAGVKIWPARDSARVSFPSVPQPPDPRNRSVQTRLTALATGARFKTKLRFHNLRPVELGAVVWALTFGRPEALEGKDSGLQHRIGMGKPLGLGQVSIRMDETKTSIRTNDRRTAPSLATAAAEFVRHMTEAYGAGNWTESAPGKGAAEGCRSVRQQGRQSLIHATRARPGCLARHLSRRQARRAVPCAVRDRQ
jgi:hypothetical protein